MASNEATVVKTIASLVIAWAWVCVCIYLWEAYTKDEFKKKTKRRRGQHTETTTSHRTLLYTPTAVAFKMQPFGFWFSSGLECALLNQWSYIMCSVGCRPQNTHTHVGFICVCVCCGYVHVDVHHAARTHAYSRHAFDVVHFMFFFIF